MTQPEPLCLIIMPFAKKRDATGRVIDFDAVYHRLVAPAVQAAGMRPVRAVEDRTGALLDRSMFERLALCEFAVVDLTTANANVVYELGGRHSIKPQGTVVLHAAGTAQSPFDLHQLNAVLYRVSPDGMPVHEAKYRTVLTERLKHASVPASDSPIYRSAERPSGLDAVDKETIRKQMLDAAEMKKRLADARLVGVPAVREVESLIGDIAQAQAGIVVELLFAYRAVKGWGEMINLVQRMPAQLAATITVQEQLALALNHAGRGDEAEQVLRDLIFKRGPSSETYSLLGSLLKNRWEQALERGEMAQAKELLMKAAAAYLKGFEADWRNTYPGVNAVTLMELKEPADPRRREILPVVHYAVEQRIRSGAADYWDYAALLELAALSCDEAKGVDALARSLARVRASWEPESTARDLRLIREARLRRGAESPEWADNAENELLKAAARGTATP